MRRGAAIGAAGTATVLVAAALAAPGDVAAQVADTASAPADTGRAPAGRQGGAGPPSDSLSLEEALETALARSPSLRGPRARASAEHAARWADWGAFLPTASASMSLSRTEEVSNTFVSEEGFPRERENTASFTRQFSSQGISLSWDLLRGGRRFVEMDAGAAAVSAAEHRLDDAERAVVADVKTAYFEALKQQRLAEIARRQLESRRRELRQARRRFRIAAVQRSDLLGARVQVRQAEVTLLEARDRAEQARRQLAVVMGGGEGAGEARAVALGSVREAPDPAGLSAAALVRRTRTSNPELAALSADVEEAAARVWAERSQYLPTLTLGYDYSRLQNLGPEGDFFTLDPGDRREGFTVSARWELFTGFGRRENTARASARLDAARAEEARRRLEVGKTVRDLVDEVKRRAESLDLLRRQLEVAEERLELLREQYRVGSADFDQLQRAVDDVTSAERALVQERYDYYSAWARLERWAGDVAPGLPGPETGGEAPPEVQGAGDAP